MLHKGKYFAISLSVAIIILCLFIGCGKNTPPELLPAPLEANETPMESQPAEVRVMEETILPENTKTPDPVEPLAHTPTYMDGAGETHTGVFTVILPESWRGQYICLNEETDMTYGLSFYEKSDYEAGLGGGLLTLTVIDTGDYYVGTKLATIITPDGYSKDLIAEYPTSFAGSSVACQEMGGDITEILESIVVADGCTIVKAGEDENVYASRANGHWTCLVDRENAIDLDIFVDGFFVYASAKEGKYIDAFGGKYEILYDDGMYQRFRFTSDEDTPLIWEASIYQTDVKDSVGIKYTGLVYQKDNGETLYFTGNKRSDDELGEDMLPLLLLTIGYRIG